MVSQETILRIQEEAKDVLNIYWHMYSFAGYVDDCVGNDIEFYEKYINRAAHLILEAKLELKTNKLVCSQQYTSIKMPLLDYLSESQETLEDFWRKIKSSCLWNKCIIDRDRENMLKAILNARKYFIENGSKN